MKRSTENERRRFHDSYTSAEDVENIYLSDLQSSAAEKKNKELDELNLPKLPQFHDDFMKICDQLGV